MGRDDRQTRGGRRDAVQVALAALRDDASPVSVARVAVPGPGPEVEPAGGDLVMRHLSFFGSFVTRRLDELDQRIDDLAETLLLLQASLARVPVATTREPHARRTPAGQEQRARGSTADEGEPEDDGPA